MPPHEYEPGDYGRVTVQAAGTTRVTWWCRVPGDTGDLIRGGALSKHQVTEHDDGSITVTPSILVFPTGGYAQWHGYLEGGTWREV